MDVFHQSQHLLPGREQHVDGLVGQAHVHASRLDD
jgi:hypothetical protein